MINLDWKTLWSEAQRGSVMDKGQQDGDKWLSFWDTESSDYLARVKKEEAVYVGIVDYLLRERAFQEGDQVLDIASGPGTYTLQFAPHAESVSALDISEGMLFELMKEADSRGLSNIRPVQSAWEQFAESDKYDLVFTAMSPAVRGPEEFLKMESLSSRSCCYITSGNEEQSRARNDLWRILDGDEKRKKVFNVSFPFNLLMSMGRKPNVRFFDYESTETMSEDQLIEYQVKFFGNFMEMDGEKRRKIAEYVNSIATGGRCDNWSKKSLVALFWDVPGE